MSFIWQFYSAHPRTHKRTHTHSLTQPSPPHTPRILIRESIENFEIEKKNVFIFENIFYQNLNFYSAHFVTVNEMIINTHLYFNFNDGCNISLSGFTWRCCLFYVATNYHNWLYIWNLIARGK